MEMLRILFFSCLLYPCPHGAGITHGLGCGSAGLGTAQLGPKGPRTPAPAFQTAVHICMHWHGDPEGFPRTPGAHRGMDTSTL